MSVGCSEWGYVPQIVHECLRSVAFIAAIRRFLGVWPRGLWRSNGLRGS